MADILSADAPVINRILELAPANVLQIDGFTHIDKDKSVTLFKPPLPDAVAISTLTGLVQALEAGIENVNPSAVLIRVASYAKVDLVAKVADKWGRRQGLVTVELMQQETKFRFNEWYPQEAFNIGLLSLFVPTPAQEELLAISGNLAQQDETRQEDDGFTQRVTAKSGVHLVGEKVVKPRVHLQPYRTFREVTQPVGQFIFRVRGGPTGNTCGLFEADGGYWKIEAMESIRTWLSNQLKGTTAELGQIPVIA